MKLPEIMKKRKHLSEFALNMHMTHTMVLQQEDLNRVSEFEYFSEDYPCHIYLITRRPRIIVDVNNFYVDEEKVIFAFKIQKQDKYEELKIEVKNTYGTTNFEMISSYPYSYFRMMREGIQIFSGKAAVLLQNFGSQYKQYLNLEILYVGQSYGVDGARTAPERLLSHSTLQGIYSEALTKNPDYEIFLVLTSFEQILLTSFDGRMKLDEKGMKEDREHSDNVLDAVMQRGLNEQQVINFTEAALIRYFEPQYNIDYKNTFPNPAHSTYSECYDLDINTICIELNTEEINCQFFSETVKPKWIHFGNFFLHSKKQRKSMFEFDKPFFEDEDEEK